MSTAATCRNDRAIHQSADVSNASDAEGAAVFEMDNLNARDFRDDPAYVDWLARRRIVTCPTDSEVEPVTVPEATDGDLR